MKRETKEEVSLDIEIQNPLKVKTFTRDDGQNITMITFLCKPLSNSIVLSEEHTEFIWLPLNESISKIYSGFSDDIKIIQRFFKSNKENNL